MALLFLCKNVQKTAILLDIHVQSGQHCHKVGNVAIQSIENGALLQIEGRPEVSTAKCLKRFLRYRDGFDQAEQQVPVSLLGPLHVWKFTGFCCTLHAYRRWLSRS